MTKILHLDTSPRGDRSHSRQLSRSFMDAWQAAHPSDTVIYRDLGHHPVPHVSEDWVAAAFTPPESHTPAMQEALAISDALVDEFLSVDRFVIGVPMYNFNVPSTFKAYIDQIVRVNRTFSMDYRGLVPAGKKMLVFTARGSDYSPGTPTAPYDYQEPFMRAIFGFIGVTDLTFVHAEKLNLGTEARTVSLTQAQERITSLVDTW